MWRNFVRVGFRSLQRNLSYTLINLTGLVLGMVLIIFVYTYIRHETNFDRFHEKTDRIYRVNRFFVDQDGDSHLLTNISTLFKRDIAKQVPGIETATQLQTRRRQVRRGDSIVAMKVMGTDANFFKVFTVHGVTGDPKTLDGLDQTFLTHEAARTLFGDENPIGKTIEVNVGGTFYPMQVGGLTDSYPLNSTIQFDLIIPFRLVQKSTSAWLLDKGLDSESWSLVFSNTYVLLKQGVSQTDVEASFDKLTTEDDITGDIAKGKQPRTYHLQPLKDLHFMWKVPSYFETEQKASPLLILLSIGLAMLAIASVNYATLSVGRLSTRYRETGIRKVLGANRSSLRIQFLTETALLTLIALVVGLTVTELTLPVFIHYAGVPVSLQLDTTTFLFLAVLFLLIVFLAGLYPTMVVARTTAADTLRENFIAGGRRGTVRRVLVGFQLIVSIAFVAMTFVMSMQMHFIRNRDLGYLADRVISIKADSEDGLGERALDRLRLDLSSDKGVAGMTAAAASFGLEWHRVSWPVGDDQASEMYHLNIVDPNFVDVMKIPVVEGRSFDPGNPSDRLGALVVNEAFVKEMGWEHPIGMTIPEGFGDAQVIGVVKNFNYQDLHGKIEPLILIEDWKTLREFDGASMAQGGTTWSFVLIRLSGVDVAGTLNRIKDTWNREVPEIAYDMHFIDESIDAQYSAEVRWMKIVSITAGLTIVIALLGVLGLSTMQVAHRTREIGIRRVFGASVSRMLMMLSRETLLLVAASTVVATPLAWYALGKWMQNFAFRIPLNPLFMVLAGFVVLATSVLTISLLSYRIVTSSPIKALRHE